MLQHSDATVDGLYLNDNPTAKESERVEHNFPTFSFNPLHRVTYPAVKFPTPCVIFFPVSLTFRPGRDYGRLSVQLVAVPPFNLSTVGKRAFPVSGANLWNSLPPHVTSAPSPRVFRQRFKTFIFRLLSYPDCHQICYTTFKYFVPLWKFW